MATSKLWTAIRRIYLKLLKVAAWSAVLLAVSAVPVHADGVVTPYIGFNFGGNSNCATLTNCEDKRRNFGDRLDPFPLELGDRAEDVHLQPVPRQSFPLGIPAHLAIIGRRAAQVLGKRLRIDLI
jgi:hypothetical protein